MSGPYTPARAVMVVYDNGEERHVELPEIQELLDEIRNLKDSLFEVRRDGELAIQKERAASRKQTRRSIMFAVPAWLMLAAILVVSLVKRLSL